MSLKHGTVLCLVATIACTVVNARPADDGIKKYKFSHNSDVSSSFASSHSSSYSSVSSSSVKSGSGSSGLSGRFSSSSSQSGSSSQAGSSLFSSSESGSLSFGGHNGSSSHSGSHSGSDTGHIDSLLSMGRQPGSSGTLVGTGTHEVAGPGNTGDGSISGSHTTGGKVAISGTGIQGNGVELGASGLGVARGIDEHGAHGFGGTTGLDIIGWIGAHRKGGITRDGKVRETEVHGVGGNTGHDTISRMGSHRSHFDSGYGGAAAQEVGVNMGLGALSGTGGYAFSRSNGVVSSTGSVAQKVDGTIAHDAVSDTRLHGVSSGVSHSVGSALHYGAAGISSGVVLHGVKNVGEVKGHGVDSSKELEVLSGAGAQGAGSDVGADSIGAVSHGVKNVGEVKAHGVDRSKELDVLSGAGSQGAGSDVGADSIGAVSHGVKNVGEVKSHGVDRSKELDVLSGTGVQGVGTHAEAASTDEHGGHGNAGLGIASATGPQGDGVSAGYGSTDGSVGLVKSSGGHRDIVSGTGGSAVGGVHGGLRNVNVESHVKGAGVSEGSTHEAGAVDSTHRNTGIPFGTSYEVYEGSTSGSGLDGVTGSDAGKQSSSGPQSAASGFGSSTSSSQISSGSDVETQNICILGVKGGRKRPAGVKGGRSNYG